MIREALRNVPHGRTGEIGDRRRIVQGIFGNITQLAGEAPDATVAPIIEEMLFGSDSYTQRMRTSVVLPFETIARNMDWKLDTPEMVFLSGDYVRRELSKKVETLGEKVAKAVTGERIFATQEARDAAIQRESQLHLALQSFVLKLQVGVDNLRTEQGFDTEYHTLLSTFPYLTLAGARNWNRGPIYRAFKKKDYPEVRRRLDERSNLRALVDY